MMSEKSNIQIKNIEDRKFLELPPKERELQDHLYFYMGVILLSGLFFSGAVLYKALFMASNANTMFLMGFTTWWVMIGIVLAYLIYLIIRPRHPQTLELHDEFIRFDRGAASINLVRESMHGPRKQLSETLHILLSSPRVRKKFTLEEVGTISINGVYDPPRLVIKKGSKEIEIGRELGQLDKIWLLRYVKDHYGMS